MCTPDANQKSLRAKRIYLFFQERKTESGRKAKLLLETSPSPSLGHLPAPNQHPNFLFHLHFKSYSIFHSDFVFFFSFFFLFIFMLTTSPPKSHSAVGITHPGKRVRVPGPMTQPLPGGKLPPLLWKIDFQFYFSFLKNKRASNTINTTAPLPTSPSFFLPPPQQQQKQLGGETASQPHGKGYRENERARRKLIRKRVVIHEFYRYSIMVGGPVHCSLLLVV